MNQAQQIKQELNGETIVTLKYPVKLATGQTLNKVTVRRPRVGDLRAVMLDLKDLEAIQATFRNEAGE